VERDGGDRAGDDHRDANLGERIQMNSLRKFHSKEIILVTTVLAVFLLAAQLTRRGSEKGWGRWGGPGGVEGDSQRWHSHSHSQLQSYASPRTQRTHHSIADVWNYCWVHADYFLHGQAPAADAAATILSGFSPVVRAFDSITWQLDTVDTIDGSPLTYGGSVIHISITGPSLLRPAVHDLRNGTYVASFWIADPGEYQAHITLRWHGCKAYVHCNSSETKQGIETVRNLNFTVVQNESSLMMMMMMEERFQGSIEGRWVHESTLPEEIRLNLDPLLAGPYVWRQFGDGGDATLRRPFPLEALRGRWLYLIGDSLSDNSYAQLVEEIVRPACKTSPTTEIIDLLVNRRDGSLMKEQITRPWPRRDGMHLFHCPSLNVTISFTYFPDFYPVSGSGQTRFPLVDPPTKSIPSLTKISFDLPSWLKHLKVVMASSDNIIPSFTKPDALVLNFGLHFAAQLDPPIYEMIVRHLLLVVRNEFPLLLNRKQGASPDQSHGYLLWRTTALTHFEEDDLAGAWSCRSPERTQLENEIAAGVVEAAGLDIIDFAQLSATRADAAPDNRHYSKGNVKATYNNLLLHKLLNRFSKGA
jgi:hypothetical protein